MDAASECRRRGCTLVYPKQGRIRCDEIELRVPGTDSEMRIMVRFVDLERLVERGLDKQLDKTVKEANRFATLSRVA